MSETPIPSSGSILNFISNFTPETQIMIIGVIAVFIMITAYVLLKKRKRFYK